MHVRRLLTDDDAVSSVVSTVLMVAITIILVAVIGSFVLNLSGAVGETAPSAAFGVTPEKLDNGNTSVIISHNGGEVVAESRVSVSVNGSQAYAWNGTNCVPAWEGSNDITAGDSINVSGTAGDCYGLQNGAEVQVIWTSEDGETSFPLVEYTV